MNILHLTSADYKTSAWSGGTTTEIFIWPENASYARREFLFRISSATVELPESDFTPLQGVERWITPLQGSFTLTHPGTEPVLLPPLGPPYRFSGETPTHCEGRATDFNLMLKGLPGKMAMGRGRVDLSLGFHGFYATQAGLFAVDGQNFSMKQGDFLAVFSHVPFSVQLGQTPVLICSVQIP